VPTLIHRPATAGDRRRRVLGLVLGVGVVLCVALGVAVEPASGTGANFQSIDDVGSQVVGEHHAKPLPRSAEETVVVVLVAAAAALALGGARTGTLHSTAGELLPGSPRDLVVALRDQVVARRSALRRGPPALLPA